jgi:hypothetical protein
MFSQHPFVCVDLVPALRVSPLGECGGPYEQPNRPPVHPEVIGNGADGRALPMQLHDLLVAGQP